MYSHRICVNILCYPSYKTLLLMIYVFDGYQWFGMPGLSSRLSTYWPINWSNKWRCSQHTSVEQTPTPCVPVASPGLKLKGSVWKADALALTNRANLAWCSDAGTGDIGVQITHEISLMEIPLLMLAQPALGEWLHTYKYKNQRLSADIQTRVKGCSRSPMGD